LGRFSAKIGLIFAISALSGAVLAAEVRLSGDRLSAYVWHEPAEAVLEAFARAGVAVRASEDVSGGEITASFANRPLEEGLEVLFPGRDWQLAFSRLPGPVKHIVRLRDLAVFAHGARAADAKELRRVPRRFVLSRGPAGTNAPFIADELLIGVRPGVSAEAFFRLLAELGAGLVAVDGKTGIYLLRLPPGSNVPEIAARLSRNPLVSFSEPNYALFPPTVAKTAPGEEPAADARALAKKLASSGDPARVAVLDTGFSPPAGLEGVAAGTLDASDPAQAITDPDGHGTAMALIASGLLPADGFASDGDIERLLAVRMSDDQGVTSAFTLLLGLAWAAENGAKVVNMSWGCEADSTALAAAVAQASRDGLLLVAAAGNDGADGLTYPAAYKSVLAVAGTEGGQPWSGSNRGSGVALASEVCSTTITADGLPARMAGTSISSATVSGALAAWWAKHPEATADEARAALLASLSPAAGEGFGAGTLDAAARARLLAAK
jgi:hypothetical protein